MNNYRMYHIAKRYAESLLQLDSSDSVLHALQKIRKIWIAESFLSIILQAPIISRETKFSILKKIAQKSKMPKIVQKFLHVLCMEDRSFLLKQMIDCYEILFWSKQNISFGVITTSASLDINIKKFLEKELNARLTYKVVPEILGGFLIEMNNQVMDVSLKTRLLQLARHMKG